VTPQFDDQIDFPNALGYLQPHLFAPSGERIAFWFGRFPWPEQIESAYRALQRTPDQIFPIRFQVREDLTTGVCAGEIPGFCSIPDGSDGPVRIEM
jgi:hypothetical protein